MVTVMVIHQSSGTPNEGERVAIGIDSFFAGGFTKYELTDKKGEAHFPDVDPCNGKVFVNGSIAYKGKIEDRMVVYV